jgi:hypothetical protein
MEKTFSKRTSVAKGINTTLTGIFFIMASVSAIIGLKLYDPILIGDINFQVASDNNNRIALGAFFELLLVCSAIGTGIMLFPYLMLINERLGLGYICFRLLEAILILIGVLSILSLATLGSFYSNNPNLIHESFNTEAIILKAIHDWTFILGPHFMLGINTFIYSFVFFKTGLVPKWLALMGLTGAILIFTAANLELFGVIKVNSIAVILMAVPIALFEMILAVRLIRKGFALNTKAIQN